MSVLPVCYPRIVRWAVTRQRRTPRGVPSLAGSSDRTHSQPHQPLRLLVARRLKPSSWSRWRADRASLRRSQRPSGSSAHSQRSARCPGRHCLNLKLKIWGAACRLGSLGYICRWGGGPGGGGRKEVVAAHTPAWGGEAALTVWAPSKEAVTPLRLLPERVPERRRPLPGARWRVEPRSLG